MVPQPIAAPVMPKLVPPSHPMNTDALIGAVRRFAAHTSFETAARDLRGIEEAKPYIAPGSTIAISWLPSDSDEDRIAAACAIRDAGCVALPHIAARRLTSAAQAERLLNRLRDEAEVDQVLLVGGDLAQPIGPYESALDLLSRTVRRIPELRRVGIGAYPERHPDIPADVLQKALDAKLAVATDAGIDTFVVTQFAFTADPILNWLAGFRERWEDVPVRIGLAGPANIRTLLRFARICGVGTSSRALISNGASIARLLAEAGPDPVIRALAAAGAPDRYGPVALHLFSFGGLMRSARWIAPVAEGRLRLSMSEAGFRPDIG